MCKPDFQLHFCTCASIKKIPLPIGRNGTVDKTEYEKTHFIWTLYKYLGEKDSLMMGDMIMPVQSLNEEMTSNFLIEQLNSGNRFDFDYSPSEGDNLQVRKEYIYKSIKGIPRPDLYDYISFIHRNGKWQEDYYDVFSDKIRKFKKGTVDPS